MKKAIVWLVLAAIALSLCGCGGKEAETRAESVGPAAAEAEKVTPEPTEKPTPEPTEESTPEPTEAPAPELRKDRNGFDEATNTAVTMAGICFPIPDYYEESDESNQNGVIYTIGDVAALIMFCNDPGDTDITEEDLTDIGTGEWKNLLKKLFNTNDVSRVAFEGNEKGSVAGFPAVFCEAKSKSKDAGWDFSFAYILNESKKQALALLFLQDIESLYDYMPDYKRVLLNAVPVQEEDNVSDELRAFLDSYEAVMNEYCDFMEDFSKNSSDLSYLMKYSEMLGKYSDMAEKAEAWEEKDMSDADTAYYLEVMGRVSKRLMEASFGMY